MSMPVASVEKTKTAAEMAAETATETTSDAAPPPAVAAEGGPGILSALAPALSVPVVLILWEAVIRYFEVEPYVFPAPSAVFLSLWNGLSSGVYLSALGTTLTEIAFGYGLGVFTGFALGILMVSSSLAERVIYPWVVAVQTVPKVAIAPLMIVWFGFGLQSKILVVALTCVFPVLVNTIAGMRATDRDRVALVRALCGSRWHVLRYIQFPSALPYIFAALNTAMVLAVIAAIVGEFVGARSGIGVLILQANFALDLAGVFALLAILSALGVALSFAIRTLERRVCFWSGRN